MIKTLKLLLTTSLLTSVVACAPTVTNQAGTTQVIQLNAVAVTEVDIAGQASPSIGLSWSTLPSTAKSVKLFRRESTQDQAEAQSVTTMSDLTKLMFVDNGTELTPDKSYKYNMRVDSSAQNGIAAGETINVMVSNPSKAKAFNITVPSADGKELPDLGFGIELKWENSSAPLYYVKVTDMTDSPMWSAFTTDTKVRYGADSQTSVPTTLQPFFSLSSTSPSAAKNEFMFKSLKTGEYKLEVKAIHTNSGSSLANAESLVVRTSGTRSFKVDL